MMVTNVNTELINMITPHIKEGYFILNENNPSTSLLVGDTYRTILNLLREKNLNDLYGSITEGVESPSILIKDLSVLLNTSNKTVLNWIVEGFPCKYMEEDGVI